MSEFKIKKLGPFHTYPKLKRDIVFTLGLIILLFALKMISG